MTEIERAPTGIEGFDFVARGGLPRGRTTLLVGAAGTGKTVFGLQFALHGIEAHDEAAVVVPFEESPADIKRTATSFGWDLDRHEEAGRLKFVDAVPRTEHQTVITGAFDLGALLARISSAIDTIGAERVVVDAVSTLFSYLPDPARIRWEMFRLRQALTDVGVTAIITAEREQGEERLTRHGVEEFVNDNVVVLRNRHEALQRQRTVAIPKLRAASHQQGEVPFTIRGDRGIAVAPLSAMQLDQETPTKRVSTGVERLDELTGGGLFQGSATLVSGATGTGKTLTACHFLAGIGPGERAMLLGYEESRTQVLRDAVGWGLPLPDLEREERLRVACDYPETLGLAEHLLMAKSHVEEFQPDRVALDSLTALQRIGNLRSFREFVLGLISFLKSRGVTLLMTSTATSESENGGGSLTETQVSSVADGLVLLRYLESAGRIDRAVAVLKLRGTAHDQAVRQLKIGDEGMQIGEPLDVYAHMLLEGGVGGHGGRLS